MIKVGLNGLGRIGRAILRKNSNNPRFQIVAVNEINPDTENLAYQLNYDTTYGRIDDLFEATHDRLLNGSHDITVYHQQLIDEVPWGERDVQILIDASGVHENVLRAPKALDSNAGLQHVLITHSPKEVDYTLVLGANEGGLDLQKHRVIACSICDATALAPVLKVVHSHLRIVDGFITTLHPWLNYQNLSDGPASSWSNPGQIYHHFALGRAAIGNMIPKPTSAVDATYAALPELPAGKIGSFSYRTPTAIVGSADLTLNVTHAVTKSELENLFRVAQDNQHWKIFHNNLEPLVSLDFCQSESSAIIDHRWTDVIGERLIKLVLWYDNEWGYASRVVDQVALVGDQLLN